MLDCFMQSGAKTMSFQALPVPRSYLLQRRSFVVCYLMEMRKQVAKSSSGFDKKLENSGTNHQFHGHNVAILISSEPQPHSRFFPQQRKLMGSSAQISSGV